MNASKLINLQIRSYQEEDYETVRELFSHGIEEAFWPALRSNWNGEHPRTIFCHLTILSSAFLASNFVGLQFVIFCLTTLLFIYIYGIYNWCYGFARFIYIK